MYYITIKGKQQKHKEEEIMRKVNFDEYSAAVEAANNVMKEHFGFDPDVAIARHWQCDPEITNLFFEARLITGSKEWDARRAAEIGTEITVASKIVTVMNAMELRFCLDGGLGQEDYNTEVKKDQELFEKALEG